MYIPPKTIKVSQVISLLLTVMVMNSSVSSCTKVLYKSTPDYRFQFELEGQEYDYAGSFNYNDVRVSAYLNDWDEYSDHISIHYRLRRPSLLDLYLNFGGSEVYYSEEYHIVKRTSIIDLNNTLDGEFGGRQIRSGVFSFEPASPEDSEVAYYLLFELVLRSSNDVLYYVKNGRLTFFKSCLGVSSFTNGIKKKNNE